MRTNKKRGISLIVLVITIIVMIILATAIILSLSNSGIIGKANKADELYEVKTMQEKIAYLKSEALLENKTLDFTNIELKEEILGEKLGELDITVDGKVIYVFKVGEPIEPENDGTTYYITKTEELMWVRDQANSGNNFSGKIVKFMNNINLGGYVTSNGAEGIIWEPISSAADVTTLTEKYDSNTGAFLGTIDGNGKTITGMCIKNSTENFNSLIGKLGTTGVVKDLNLSGIYIKGDNSNYIMAGLVSLCSGTIENCSVDGTISANNYEASPEQEPVFMSGLVAYATSAKIKNCISSVDMKLTLGFSYSTSGMIGTMVGGVVSYPSGTAVISNCANNGNISVNAPEELKNLPEVHVGGISAHSFNSTQIIGCYNRGNMNVKGYVNLWLGGIVSYSAASNAVENCYNVGDIDISDLLLGSKYGVGGIEGRNQGKTVKNCYMAGNIFRNTLNTTSCYLGMLVGYNNTATVTSAYYPSGSFGPFGASSGTITSVRALSVSEMKSTKFVNILNTLDNTQESLEIFKLDTNNINKGYPILSWQ